MSIISPEEKANRIEEVVKLLLSKTNWSPQIRLREIQEKFKCCSKTAQEYHREAHAIIIDFIKKDPEKRDKKIEVVATIYTNIMVDPSTPRKDRMLAAEAFSNLFGLAEPNKSTIEVTQDIPLFPSAVWRDILRKPDLREAVNKISSALGLEQDKPKTLKSPDEFTGIEEEETVGTLDDFNL